MSQFIPPTAHSASERAKFDRLRRQMDGRPYAFLGHTVRAIAAEVHPLPKTNHPSFPIFSDDAIMENTESYTVRQNRHDTLEINHVNVARQQELMAKDRVN